MMGKQGIKRKRKKKSQQPRMPQAWWEILALVSRFCKQSTRAATKLRTSHEPDRTSTLLYFQVFSTLFLEGNSSVLSEQVRRESKLPFWIKWSDYICCVKDRTPVIKFSREPEQEVTKSNYKNWNKDYDHSEPSEMVKLHWNVQNEPLVLYLMERISNVKSRTYAFNQGALLV